MLKAFKYKLVLNKKKLTMALTYQFNTILSKRQ